MIGHLGARVSALLDGQLDPAEAERCWEHVHECHVCRDLVEREGWIKTQLAGLSFDRGEPTPDALKGSLTRAGLLAPVASHASAPSRSRSGVTLLGGTALGAAVVGVLALGVAQSGAPVERRPPVTNLNRSVSATPTSAVEPVLRLTTHRVAGGIAGFKMVP